jgi:peptidyl-prolyl cis-trans isomerase C
MPRSRSSILPAIAASAALLLASLASITVVMAATPTPEPAAAAPGVAPGAASSVAPAASNDSETLLRTPAVTITRGDYRHELDARVPKNMRRDFATSPRRVTELIDILLVNHTLALRAREAGYDKDPDVQAQIASEITRVLAKRELQAIDEKAGREFDARDMTAAARERYLVDSAQFQQPEQVSASHILFEISKHGDEGARKLAEEARKRVLAGEDFNALATQVSDDPSAKSNHGHLGFFPASGRMDPAFSKAAFALARAGEVSEPVRTPFGWHIIRLEDRKPAGKRPFEEVKAQIIADMRRQYVEKARNDALAAIRTDPALQVNQPAIDALVEPFVPPEGAVPPR